MLTLPRGPRSPDRPLFAITAPQSASYSPGWAESSRVTGDGFFYLDFAVSEALPPNVAGIITAMNLYWLSRTVIATVVWATSCIYLTAQAGSKAATPPPVTPFTMQIKKTVVFLQADCLHDFRPEIAQLTPDTLAKLTPQQVIAMKQQLITIIGGLGRLKQSTDKLALEEVNKLKPEVLFSLDLPQIGNLVVKMMNLTTEDINKLTPEEIATLPTDSHMGTGFIVSVPDERMPIPAESKDQEFGFSYLVTNRHVAQPGIEEGKPCVVLDYFMMLNRKADSTHNAPFAEKTRFVRANWHFSTDDSVDLAVSNFSPSVDLYDYQRVPVGMFSTPEMVEQRLVVEGDPVQFSGLFIQAFQQVHTVEPILRSGSLAMVPKELMETTLHKPGRIYLAEAHAFAGNSGSPMFIDINKFNNLLVGPSYRLLGVISGEVQETSDFILHISTSYSANVVANSDVSVVVPANEIKSILYDSALQGERDAFVARTLRTK